MIDDYTNLEIIEELKIEGFHTSLTALKYQLQDWGFRRQPFLLIPIVRPRLCRRRHLWRLARPSSPPWLAQLPAQSKLSAKPSAKFTPIVLRILPRLQHLLKW